MTVAPISKDIEVAIIPENVTIEGEEYRVYKIENKSFQNCEKLHTLVLPDNIITIYSNTFKGCTALRTVILGAKMDGIALYSFPTYVPKMVYPELGKTALEDNTFFRSSTYKQDLYVKKSAKNLGVDWEKWTGTPIRKFAYPLEVRIKGNGALKVSSTLIDESGATVDFSLAHGTGS